MMIDYYSIYMCKMCEMLVVCETNANLVHSYHMNQQLD